MFLPMSNLRVTTVTNVTTGTTVTQGDRSAHPPLINLVVHFQQIDRKRMFRIWTWRLK